MAEVKLRALGLREVDFGDFDRYLTALTEDGRRIEILCKNARRGKKQNPAARQLCYSEFILSDRGGRYTLRDADLVHSFFALAGDIEKYALSCYLNELTTALTVPDFDNPALCRLLLYALYALEGGKRDPELVKAAFDYLLEERSLPQVSRKKRAVTRRRLTKEQKQALAAKLTSCQLDIDIPTDVAYAKKAAHQMREAKYEVVS